MSSVVEEMPARSRRATSEEKAAFNQQQDSAADVADVGSWPEALSDAAYQGLAGDIVQTIEPVTEADSAALLIQVLVAFGALIGRGPHIRVEGDEHHCNLFALLIGETSKARKGTSWGRVHEIFKLVEAWPKVVQGLSTGEGLKFAVRNPIERLVFDKKTGQSEMVLVDPGVDDKRLLVQESEFSQVLRQGARPGNTLSATLRSAWDTGYLATLTKTDPITATGAHISIIGHITAQELRSEMTTTDMGNGFCNRIIPMAVKRSKKLPFGGGAIPGDIAGGLAQRLAKAAADAQKLQSVTMTAAAKEVWVRVYDRLSEGYDGMLGAVTGRSEAQCLRLALAYALMDNMPQIDAPHLLAAIAAWERAEATAMYVFGSALGDAVADEILRALRAAGPVGMTRTEISALFKRNQPADRLGVALELLRSKQKALKVDQPDTGGRPIERWKCI